MSNLKQIIFNTKKFQKSLLLLALVSIFSYTLQPSAAYADQNPFLPTTDILNTGLTSQVGADELSQASADIANFKDITGAYYDSTNNRVVFIGTTSGTNPNYNPDDMYVAVRAILTNGTLPSLSIDDQPGNPTGSTANVNYTGNIQNTTFANELFNADYKLKQYAIGSDPNGHQVTSSIPTYQSVVARYLALQHSPVAGNESKFIITPQTVAIKTATSASAFVFTNVTMQATAQAVNQSNDTLWNQAANNFANDITANYSQYSQETPYFTQAQQLAKIVAIVKWVNDYSIPTDALVARNYTPQFVSTPSTVQKVATSSGYFAQGGVNYNTPNTYLPDDGTASNLKTSAQSGSNSNQDVTWTFTSGGQQYTAVAVAAGAFKSLGGYSTSIDDMSFRIADDQPLTFTRSYNSFSTGQSGIGLGWDFMPARIYSNAPNASNVTTCNNVSYYTKIAIDTPNGHETYTFSCGSGYSPDDPSFHSKVVQNSDGTANITVANQTKYNFNATQQLTQILDKNSNAINFNYATQSGNLTSISDTHNHSVSVSYNGQNLISQVTDWTGRAVKYNYDGSGRLTSVIDPNGNTTTYTYDSNNRLTTTTDRNSQLALTNTYNGDSRLATSKNAANLQQNYTYDNVNKIITQTDSNNNTQKTYYDAKARILQQIDPAGKSVTFTYGNETAPLTYTDKNNNKETFTYDSNGNMLSGTFPDNSVINYSYDSNNRLTKVLDGRYSPTKESDYTYDGSGNLTQKTIAGLITKYTYDSTGEALTTTDPLNHTTTWTRDSFGNMLTQTNPLNNATTYQYDSLGRLIKVIDASNNVTNFTYDADGSVLTKVDAAGTTTNTYDKEERLKTVKDADGNTTTYAYNASGKMTSVTDPLNYVTSYGYDAYSNLTSQQNALNQITTNTFDTLNRETQSSTPLGKVTKWGYDANGNITSRTDANNQTTNYTYDILNRLTKITYPNSTTVTFTLDSRGNRTKMVDPLGTSTYTYDTFDRLTQAVDDYNHTTTYTYDNAGNMKTLKYDDGSLVTYGYDSDNEMTSVLDWNNHTTSYTYNKNGSLATRTLPNGIVTTYSYDGANRLSSIVHKKSTTTLAQFLYTRDPIGDITIATESGSFISSSPQTTKFTYDADRRLLYANYPSSNTYTYTYDKAGNMLTNNAVNDPNSGNFSNIYTYDNDNKMTSEALTQYGIQNTYNTFNYDNSGNMTEKPSENFNPDWTYTYDYENRMTQLVTSAGNTWSYTYDGLGNRMQTYGSTASWRYINDISGTVPRTLAIASANGSGGIIEKYLYGISLIYDDGSGYYLEDGLGNVRFVTNSSGGNNGSVSYDPYGNFRSFQGANAYEFQQQYQDSESGNYYLHSRYYDPTLYRFVSKDPVAGNVNQPISQNGYAFTNDNPVNVSDPNGNCVEDACIVETALAVEGVELAAESPEGQETIEYTINTYANLRSLTEGDLVEVHHIIEKRLADILGADQDNMLSVILTKGDHRAFTTFWRQLIGYSNGSNPINTVTATPQDIWAAAQKIYANYPTLLDAARITIFGN